LILKNKKPLIPKSKKLDRRTRGLEFKTARGTTFVVL